MDGATPESPSETIRPDDPRFPALSRGFNQRWIAKPDYVRMVYSADDAVKALQQALDERKDESGRITVRSGGHCYEDFVCGDDVRVIFDTSPMHDVYWDEDVEAYCVEAGATNWHAYSHLYPAAGVTLPGGSCYSVGIGGHVPGGGFGLLSRHHGLTVDYLYGVEVVVADKDRMARRVRATADDNDEDHRRLLWAHTGGGGGNFGVLTKLWFRDLPEPPAFVRLCGRAWKWEDFDQQEFHKLLTAYGTYFRDNQDPSTHSGRLFALLKLNHRSNGEILLTAQVDCESPDNNDPGKLAMDEFLAAVDGAIGPESSGQESGTGDHPAVKGAKIPRVMPWLTATQALNSSGENSRGKYKSACIRKPFTAEQIDAMWDYLGNGHYTKYRNPRAVIQIDSYGGRINEVGPAATAVAQRDSIMKMQYQVYWTTGDPEEPTHIRWIRDTYAATFAATNGVPEIGGDDAVTDGCYINYPDADLGDDEWNDSWQTWAQLYYKDAYPALRKVKARWDPHNVFRHRQSIETWEEDAT
ncbi:FAD-binding oxidoreductase [Streptomonospora halophila]|uniref:FAD-binding oxidoreductase n=1 Tax=Streptomonospora halophila TaxID=427369 RepID=A0ABP9GED8_9ACTN